MSKWDCFIFLYTFENKYSGGTIVCALSGTLATLINLLLKVKLIASKKLAEELH